MLLVADVAKREAERAPLGEASLHCWQVSFMQPIDLTPLLSVRLWELVITAYIHLQALQLRPPPPADPSSCLCSLQRLQPSPRGCQRRALHAGAGRGLQRPEARPFASR